jgi:hypothetical protein
MIDAGIQEKIRIRNVQYKRNDMRKLLILNDALNYLYILKHHFSSI